MPENEKVGFISNAHTKKLEKTYEENNWEMVEVPVERISSAEIIHAITIQ